MIKAREDINRLNAILKDAYMKTPAFLNGLLIPSWNVEEFYIIIHRLYDKAKDSEEYWEQILENTHKSQEATNDFITTLVKGIGDGSIKFGGKKDEQKREIKTDKES